MVTTPEQMKKWREAHPEYNRNWYMKNGKGKLNLRKIKKEKDAESKKREIGGHLVMLILDDEPSEML